jgi:hypothetical protein
MKMAWWPSDVGHACSVTVRGDHEAPSCVLPTICISNRIPPGEGDRWYALRCHLTEGYCSNAKCFQLDHAAALSDTVAGEGATPGLPM